MLKSSLTKLVLLLISLVFIVCNTSKIDKRNSNEMYIDEAFTLIEKNIINEKKINIDSLKTLCLNKLNSSTTIDSLHTFINSALQSINKHSYLYSPKEFNNFFVQEDAFNLKGKIINDNIAYVYVGECMVIDSINSNNYADSLQSILRDLYQKEPKGWIIDLRGAGGGNMYAMIAGLGPLFSEGYLGYSINEEKENPWYFKKRNDKNEIEFIELAANDYEFDEKLPLVGLIDSETGSASEAVAISLKCYPKSTLIGEKSAGYSTCNMLLPLSDSSYLMITHSIMADCEKNKYPIGVEPDIRIDNPFKIFEESYEWIYKNSNDW